MRILDWIRSLFWDDEGWDEGEKVIFLPSDDGRELEARARAAGFEALLRIVAGADESGAPLVTGQLEIPFDASDLERIKRLRDRVSMAEFLKDAAEDKARACVAIARIPGSGQFLAVRIDVPVADAADWLRAQNQAVSFLIDALEALRTTSGAAQTDPDE